MNYFLLNQVPTFFLKKKINVTRYIGILGFQESFDFFTTSVRPSDNMLPQIGKLTIGTAICIGRYVHIMNACHYSIHAICIIMIEKNQSMVKRIMILFEQTDEGPLIYLKMSINNNY